MKVTLHLLCIFDNKKFTVYIDLVFKMPAKVVINNVVYLVEQCQYCESLFQLKDLYTMKRTCIVPYWEYICAVCMNEVPECKKRCKKCVT